jgi:hypothetical protein
MQLIPVSTVAQLEEEAKKSADKRQNSPFIQSIASHAKKRWELVRDSRSEVEERLAKCLRQRNGEYDPDILADIRKQGGSEIYSNLTSVKCRGASAWLRDTLLGTGSDKPWSLDHTPVPDLPPEVLQKIHATLTQMVMQYMAMSGGASPPQDLVRQQAEQMRDQVQSQLRDEAKKRVERMELKMEDQLVEGGFMDALGQFIDDLVTFPTAILKGPVARKRKKLKWNGTVLDPVEDIVLEWERVDPFKAYPAPWASDVNDGFFVERHRLTRGDLEALIGVEGYSEQDIRAVLSEFTTGGLKDWLSVDQMQLEAEGKDASANDEADLIDAIQLWDEVPGSLLVEWGMDDGEVADKDKSYPCEIWLIGTRVIKAVLNYDPLGRKPYYATSYEKIPGAFWGKGIPDLVRDSQQMCNAAARALSNNMGIASGPQVAVNIDRLPAGEPITQLYPWKVWQTKAADYQDSSQPLTFFQPNSNAAELLGVFEKFMSIADELSGIPRYLQGEHTPGVGRTSSGLAMLMNNASKGLKQVIHNVDKDCLTKMLERHYQHNLRYATDPDLIGDVSIVAKGAMSLVNKETANARRNEFLQLTMSSPLVQQIIGPLGAAELLRDMAKSLDLSVDNIVPSREELQKQLMEQAAQQQAMMQAQMQMQGAQQPQKPRTLLPDGSVSGGRDSNLVMNKVSGVNGGA